MSNLWMLDVLSDLESYAATHGLNALAEQIDQCHKVAQAEIAASEAATEIKIAEKT